MKDIGPYIEHTILEQDTTRKDIENYCNDAIKFGFKSVCIPPLFIRDSVSFLKEHNDIHVCTVIGYPMGYAHTAAKVEEIKKANDSGAHCVEIMINLAAVIDNNWAYVTNDIQSTVTTAQLKGLSAKVILETSKLKSKDILQLCNICIDAGAEYIISSSSYDAPLADVQSIKLLKRFVEDKIGIQASGKIVDFNQIEELLDAGANILTCNRELYLFHNEMDN